VIRGAAGSPPICLSTVRKLPSAPAEINTENGMVHQRAVKPSVLPKLARKKKLIHADGEHSVDSS
jgi:hypothetical protein